MKHKTLEKILLGLTLVIFLIYTSFQWHLYLETSAIVPDESTFFHIMNTARTKVAHGMILDFSNELGYGSLFWIIGGVFRNLVILRFLAFIYMVSIPIFIYLIGKSITNNNTNIYLSVLLWLTFPAAWFYGKLIGPELLSMFLGMFGIFLILQQKNLKYIGYIFISMSIGIKLNNIIYLFFAIVFLELLAKKNVKHLLLVGLSISGGFVISNIFILKNPKTLLQQYKRFAIASDSNFSMDRFSEIFTGESWTWDNIYSGAFLSLSMGVIPLFILMYLVILLKKTNFKLLYAIVSSFIFAIIMLTKRGGGFGWYWYPFLTILPLILICLDLKKIEHIFVVLLLVVINFYTSYPLIQERIDNKIAHIVASSKADKDLNLPIPSNYKLYNFYEWGYSINGHEFGHIKAFENIKNANLNIPCIIVLGDRLTKHQSLKLPQVLENISQKGYCPTYLKRWNNSTLIRVTEKCKI